MNKLKSIVIAAFIAIVSVAYADQPAHFFNDYASVVTAEQSAVLNQKLQDLEKRTGTQFIVSVYPSLNGQNLETFTVNKCKEWGLGQKDKNNGLGLFVFTNDRKMRFEVGYGLEGVLTDSASASIIRNNIAPFFKRQDYYGGINSGIDSAINLISSPAPATDQAASTEEGGGVPLLVLVVRIGLFGMVFIARATRGSSDVEEFIKPVAYTPPVYTPRRDTNFPAVPVMVSAITTSTKKKKKKSDDDGYTRNSSSYSSSDHGSSSSSSSSFDFGGGGGGGFGGGGASGGW